MSLNHLLSEHQILLMRADAAPTGETRRGYEALAADVAARVDRTGAAAGATAAPLARS